MPSPHPRAVEPTYLSMECLIILYLFKEFRRSRYDIGMVDYIIWSNCNVSFKWARYYQASLCQRITFHVPKTWGLANDLLWQVKYDWKWLCHFWTDALRATDWFCHLSFPFATRAACLGWGCFSSLFAE